MALTGSHNYRDPGFVAWTNEVDTAINALPSQYYTKEEVEALIAAAVGAVPQEPDAPPVSPYKPDDVLNIGATAGKNHFYLQVARTGDASYLAKTQAEIQAGYEEVPYFYTDTDGGGIERVHLQARLDAPTTSGTAYSRCELRELDQAGANIAFNAKDSNTHRMVGKTRLTHLPPNKPEIVFAQLHDGNRDRIALRTQAISGSDQRRAIAIRVNGSQSSPGWNEEIEYVVGREIDWKMECVAGTWNIYIDNMTTPKSTFAASALVSSSTSWYFKTGCYNQSEAGVDDVGTEYGAVELRDLLHWHTGWTANQAFPVLT